MVTHDGADGTHDDQPHEVSCVDRQRPGGSMIRPGRYGPRSVIRTTTIRPYSRSVTRTRVPNDNVRWAAVRSYISKGSPVAVGRAWCARPYHDAIPSSPCRDSGGESMAQPASATITAPKVELSFLVNSRGSTPHRQRLCQHGMKLRHHRGAFADRPADSLRGSGSDVPDREHARDAGLQRQPTRGVILRPGAHEAF